MPSPSLPPSLQLLVRELVQKLYHLKVHQISSREGSERNEATQSPTNSCSPTKTNSGSRNGTKRKSSEDGEDIHPNLSSLLAVLESRHAYYFIYPYLRFTLFDCALHSPAMLEDSVAKPLFILYQLLNLLNHCHSKGATLGDLGLKNIFADARLWVQIRLPYDLFRSPPSEDTGTPPPTDNNNNSRNVAEVGSSEFANQMPGIAVESADVVDRFEVSSEGMEDHVTPSPTPIGSQHPSHAGSTNTLTGLGGDEPPSSASKSSYVPQALHLCEGTQKWRIGELSNFDYLMLLNQHAGRVMGDPNNHPIFPWVMEFTYKDGGYRDLTKSKFRLNKGDRQLDFTFISTQEEMRRGQDQESLVPHHIGDISSDVTYYVYLARKTPKEVLCSRVRPQWVPKEYPSSVEKMYIWTPDECIPEFYADPSIFKSIHPDLPDLTVPDWARSPEDLVSVHRGVLEGDHVSANLHHWIDLMFGYKLTGHDAIKAKNVYVSLVDKHKDPKNCGIVQLFKSSHPKRIQTSSAPLAISSWSTYLNMSSMMNATNISINRPSARMKYYASPEPDDGKTLESIIIEQAVNQQSVPLHEDGGVGDGRQESLDEDFTGSFEHVNIDEVKEKMHAASRHTPAGPGLPNTEFGVNYEETPAVSSSELKPPPPLSKTRGDQSMMMPVPSNRFKVPVVNMLFNRQRHKPSTVDNEVGYYWQQEEVSFPKEANILQRLNKLEDMAHFTFRSCKDDGGLYKEQWRTEDFLVFEVSYSMSE